MRDATGDVIIGVMRKRWSWLAGSALVTLLGFFWHATRWEVRMSSWDRLQIGGLLVCIVISGVAAISNFPKRWPGAVALLAAAPLLQLMFSMGKDLAIFIAFAGAPALMMFMGSVGTVISAVVVLVVSPPPLPAAPIAPAKVI